MPRQKDPIWSKFELERNPIGVDFAKCKICGWKTAGVPHRMNTHYSTKHASSAHATKGKKELL
jgi:hypothetical protein